MRRAAADGRGRRERGSVMVIGALAMVALLMFAALAIDVGIVWSARTQSQSVSDAAALTAAMNMLNSTHDVVQMGIARDEAVAVAAANSTVANPSVTIDRGQHVTFGYYDISKRQLDQPGAFIAINSPEWGAGGYNGLNPAHVRAAKVDVVMDGGINKPAPTFLAGLMGRNSFTVKNSAIAYLGFAGDFASGEFELPVAIDSCDLVSDSDGCGNDFCTLTNLPVNPDSLVFPQNTDSPDNVTLLDFSSTPIQNACWTVFDGSSPAVGTPNTTDVIDNGNPNDTAAGDTIYLDNGEKAPATRRIYEKFYGLAVFNGNPAGEDRYPDPYTNHHKIDSWVVKLPVMECQDGTNCAGGAPQRILGGVCFQVREVISPPYTVGVAGGEKSIRGRFLCPNSPDPELRLLYDTYCAPDPNDPPARPGGCDFGISAQTVVLVE